MLTPWTKSRLLGFRFFALFFTLNIFPFPLSLIPGVDKVTGYYDSAWEALVKWTGKYLLHIPYDVVPMQNGSGDTTYSYVQFFLFLIIALLASIIWTVPTVSPATTTG